MLVAKMRLPVFAAVIAAVLAVAQNSTDNKDLVLVQLRAALEKGGKGDENVVWNKLQRVEVLPPQFPMDKIDEDSCTFVEALGKWKNGDLTVYMVGDSTMFHQAKGACMVATKHLHTQDGPWSTPGFGVLMETPPKELVQSTLALAFVDGTHFGCEIPLPYGHKLTLAFYAVGRPPQDVDSLRKMHQVFGSTPDVIYFGAGLHYFHMEPFDTWAPEAMRGFVHLEEDMHNFLNSHFVKKTPTIVYFNCHSICDERYTGDYAKVVSGLKYDPKHSAEKCATAPLVAQSNMSLQQCLDSFMVRENALKFNGKAEAIIQAWSAKNPRQQIKFVDGFGITDADKCEHTDVGDGRHYQPLVPTELAELLKQVGAVGSVDADYLEKAGC